MLEFILKFIHLFTAIAFIGYVFFDVILCKNVENIWKIKKAYFKSSGIIYAIIFILLICSGILLGISKYDGYSDYLKYILIIKIFLIIIMILITAISIYMIRIKKNDKHFLVIYAHHLALIICFFIAFLAKILAF